MYLVIRYLNGKKYTYGYGNKNVATNRLIDFAKTSDNVFMLNLDDCVWSSALTLKDFNK